MDTRESMVKFCMAPSMRKNLCEEAYSGEAVYNQEDDVHHPDFDSWPNPRDLLSTPRLQERVRWE